MTRLTEALERAQASNQEVPTAVDPPRPVRDVPAEWQFSEIDRGVDEPAVPETSPRRVAVDVARDPAPASNRTSPNLPASPDGEARREKLVIGKHDNLLIEQFRRLAAVLHHAQLQRGTQSVMIASAVPSEGKSLTATNLALTLSGSYEKRVLLIDTDLRRPSLHTLFNVSNSAGVTTSLNDPQQMRLPVVQAQRNLWLLPAGPPDPNPTSLVTSPAMKQLLTEALAQFDWVILDTPPVGLMPDANLLASMVDAAFVVVKAGHTPYPLVKKAIDAIGLDRVLGVVLNRADRSVAAGTYSYGYYDYYTDESSQTNQGRKRLALG